MPSFQFKLHGFPAANRDAMVKLVHESSGKEIQRKPFLDGSLKMSGLDSGYYQMKVLHPNLVNPIAQKRIRLFDQKPPTVIPVPIPEDVFKDSPIRDLPDADLSPVEETATQVKEQLGPIGSKAPGEAIKSSDWNILVNGVMDLSDSVLELTKLVSPKGHDHPEIAEKIAEVQGNILRFSEAFGKSILELQREIETENLKKKIEDLLDEGEASEEVRTRVKGRVYELAGLVQSDPSRFTHKLANTGRFLLTEINSLAVTKGDAADEFLNSSTVKETINIASHYSDLGTAITPEQEIQTYRKTATAQGGLKIGSVLRTNIGGK